jgi:nucleoside-diphosphate-sugar epimerase
MTKRRVVLTGASGYVAGRMLAALRERYDLVLLDVKSTNRQSEQVEGLQTADLLDRDRDHYQHHFKDADAVVHCGFVHTGGGQQRFWNEADNIAMAHNVYRVCQDQSVRRAVIISSNHAADYYEDLIWSGRQDFVTPDMLPLSDNFYGWAKASYELLGFMFACGKEGAALENVQLRIGGPRETDADGFSPEDLKKMHRGLGAYLSVRDQVQLVTKSIETEDIRDANGVPFQIFYGISGNSHNFWSLANARRIIGYAPQDNSQIRFADKLAAIIQQAQEQA